MQYYYIIITLYYNITNSGNNHSSNCSSNSSSINSRKSTAIQLVLPVTLVLVVVLDPDSGYTFQGSLSAVD